MGLSPDRIARMVKVMRDVQKDCEDEASTIDGKPFDGRTVAIQFGNVLAEISAVARVVELLLAEVTPVLPPEGVDSRQREN